MSSVSRSSRRAPRKQTVLRCLPTSASGWLLLLLLLFPTLATPATDVYSMRPRLIIETDAGGDPDDEQSLVRFLLYSDVWDVEGIIANRPVARDGENLNPVRTGLGIVQRQLDAYAACYPNLRLHDARYPKPEVLRRRTVSGANDMGSTSRENTLKRWAADLQNDFRARLDWCVRDFANANHPPQPRIKGTLPRSRANRRCTSS